MLIIELDKGSLTTGTVIAHALYIKEALRYIFSGRDGAKIEGRRICNGIAKVGSRVTAYEPTPEEVRAQFIKLQNRDKGTGNTK